MSPGWTPGLLDVRRDSNSRPSGSKESGVNSKSRLCRGFRAAAALLHAFPLCSEKSCFLSVLAESQFRHLFAAESIDLAGFH